jgi:hypothetical protein
MACDECPRTEGVAIGMKPNAFHIFTKSSDSTKQQHYLVVAKNEAAALDCALTHIGEDVYPRPQITVERVVRICFEDSDEEMFIL